MTIRILCFVYRRVVDALTAARDALLPAGAVVCVQRPNRSMLYGIASREGACPPNQLPVRLENGNVWWYDLNTIHASRRSECWPGWIAAERAASGAEVYSLPDKMPVIQRNSNT